LHGLVRDTGNDCIDDAGDPAFQLRQAALEWCTLIRGSRTAFLCRLVVPTDRGGGLIDSLDRVRPCLGDTMWIGSQSAYATSL
jgi:hypothetical protein